MTIRDAAKKIVLDKFPSIHSRYAQTQARRDLRVEVSELAIDIIDKSKARRIRLARNNHALIEGLMDNFEEFFCSVEAIPITLWGRRYSLVDFSTPRYHDIVGFPDFPILCPTTSVPFISIQQYIDTIKPKPGEVVIDLGAYCGLTAICISKMVGDTGSVIALEPDPKNFSAAFKNIDRYCRTTKRTNIALIHAAVAAQSGTISINAEGTTNTSASAITDPWRCDNLEVNCLSLLDIVRQFGVASVDVIKMDIEGSELPLLEGSGSFFERYRPRMVIEPHIIDGVLVSKQLISILEKYGYACDEVQQAGACFPLILAHPNR